MLDTTMHIYLCQDWCIISLLSSRTMPFTIVLVKLKKFSLSISSQGMGTLTLQEQHHFESPMGHMESTQTYRTWTTSNCDDCNRIIPVTVFLIMLFNACFMYQPKADTNLLITALHGFDYGMSSNDDTFMSTMSKFFHQIKLNWFWIICLLPVM